VENEENLSISA